METKHCFKCGETKPIDAFPKDKSKRDGLGYRCKTCTHAAANQWRHQNKDRVNAARRARYARDPSAMNAASAAWAKKNPAKVRNFVSKLRAKKIGAGAVVVLVDHAAIIARDNGTCYLCGKRPTGKQLHIDHVVPLTRGGDHTAENLRVACRSCNSRKGNKLLSELDWYKP